jgi:uncharacterized membrane protein
VNEFTIVLFLHLFGVLLFVSGIVVAGVAFEFARRRREPGEIALLLTTTRAGVLMVAIGTLLLGGFGLWLVHIGNFGYRTGWIDASIALFTIALVLGALGGQRPKRARRLATTLAAEHATAAPQLRALLDDPLSRGANYASLITTLAILAVMVFKP